MRNPGVLFLWTVLAGLALCALSDGVAPAAVKHKNAYATMMYMGTPRDYEFYVGLRVLLRSLAHLKVDADLVVLASKDVPAKWVAAMENEDGAKVVSVDNVKNPYVPVDSDDRFRHTLNKLYAWKLVEYERVVMLDTDNLFLHNTDELFQCGQFCAVFINPCIFHTGLFVLQPSEAVFDRMMQQLIDGRPNPDGADQGFLVGWFDDLLERPMFKPPANGTRLDGYFRLPLGYQMDASYFYLKLRWSVPCGPNSVITFPSAPLLKPWYWWSWPVLPLGLAWHEQRRNLLGYADDLPHCIGQTAVFLLLLAALRLFLTRTCNFRSTDRSSAAAAATSLHPIAMKCALLLLIAGSYCIPFYMIHRTVHPILGWTLYLAGSSSLMLVVASAFSLPLLPALTPSIGIAGALLVMAYPAYHDGIVRTLSIWAYSFACAPFLWSSIYRLLNQVDALIPSKTGELPLPQFIKVY
ncbi:unnamed protein product [Victoria cruziana]